MSEVDVARDVSEAGGWAGVGGRVLGRDWVLLHCGASRRPG